MVKGIQRFARRAFRAHAATVARCPVAFMVAPLLVAAALCIGLTRLTIDSDPNLVWVPPDSEVNRQKQFFDAAFDPFFRVNQVILALNDAPASEVDAAARAAHAAHRKRWRRGGGGATVTAAAAAPGGAAADVSAAAPLPPAEASVGGRGGGQTSRATAGGGGAGGGDPAGILTQAYFQAVLNLTQALSSTPDSAGTVLDDICYKPIAGRGCLVESPLDYFRTDPALIVRARRLCGRGLQGSQWDTWYQPCPPPADDKRVPVLACQSFPYLCRPRSTTRPCSWRWTARSSTAAPTSRASPPSACPSCPRSSWCVRRQQQRVGRGG